MFNTYDEKDRRVTRNGSLSTKIEDEAIVRNLRFRWPEELKRFSDTDLVNVYDDFASTEMFGDNDEQFLEYIKDVESA